MAGVEEAAEVAAEVGDGVSKANDTRIHFPFIAVEAMRSRQMSLA